MTASAELLKKLQIKAGARLLLINMPLPLAEAITAGAEVEPVKLGERFDGAIAFCANPTEVNAFAEQILRDLPKDGLLWFAYRKGAAGKKAGLTRDHGWDALERAGFRPVRSISLDDNWTGLRFRPNEAVRAKEGSRFSRRYSGGDQR
jgi:hypothetical protein